MAPAAVNSNIVVLLLIHCYTRSFIRKIGYINFVPKLVSLSIRPYICQSVTFLVIVSSPNLLDVVTSNFAGV